MHTQADEFERLADADEELAARIRGAPQITVCAAPIACGKADGQLVHDRLARLAAGEALAGRPAPLVRCVFVRARNHNFQRCLRNEYVTGQSARRRRSAPRTAARARSPSRSARRAARSSTATRPRPPRARTRSATATPPPSRPRAMKTWTASSRRSSSAADARRGRRSGDDARLYVLYLRGTSLGGLLNLLLICA